VVVRDLPLADRPVVLVWAKRLWRCPEPACPARTWSEGCDQIAPRAVLTERARAEIARRVGPAEHSVAQAARDFGVSWHAAMAAVRDQGRPRVDHLARLGAPRAIELDETSAACRAPAHAPYIRSLGQPYPRGVVATRQGSGANGRSEARSHPTTITRHDAP
jgi:hypothetical protein